MGSNDSNTSRSGREVVSDGSHMNIRTNRIGLLSIHATAPVVDGVLSEQELEFTVRIDRVETGNPLLDPELHALIHQITSGTLIFRGQRSGEVFSGSAKAGSITVPLDLRASDAGSGLELDGRSEFSDVHVPLPGLGHIRHLEVDIDGRIHLA
ncbi:MAG: hypothetical protein R2686_01945 [Candidatus Nanopelagicales bacterium]